MFSRRIYAAEMPPNLKYHLLPRSASSAPRSSVFALSVFRVFVIKLSSPANKPPAFLFRDYPCQSVAEIFRFLLALREESLTITLE
jgi:hypothetical protein